ncbi:peptidylprolyl isomerase [Blattabacterium cuenoti]|uniref:peptidylprolyl isomerase n=1 Tax=Blattabacterium cuenoti TaxID=1653831 RepID=UPI00163C7A5F|nr:hypothetical protein [Blattabacterium cuenoti]
MILLFLIITIGLFQISFSMEKVDGIYAIVGDEIILESEMRKISKNKDFFKIFNDLLLQKLMMYHAKRDPNIEINEKELKFRINLIFLDKINQCENKEYYFNNKNNEKDLFNTIRDVVRNNMYIEELYYKITSNIEVSPDEIKYFIIKHKNKIFDDQEKMYINSSIFFIKKNKIKQKKILNFLTQIKTKMVKGVDPSILFKHPFLRFFICKNMSFKKININIIPYSYKKLFFHSKKNQVFGPFKHGDKFYLIKLIKKEKNFIDIDCISIQKKYSNNDYFKTKSFLELSRKMVLRNWIKLEDIGIKNKCVKNYFQYKNWINEKQLPKDIKEMLHTIKKGEITRPFLGNFDGKKAFFIIQLIDRIKSDSSLSDQDFKKIESIIKEVKIQNVMENWFHKMIKKTYISIQV